MNLTHIRILTFTHARYSLRGGGGIVFIVLALITSMLIASFALDSIDRIEKQYRDRLGLTGADYDRQQFIDTLVAGLRPHLQSWIGEGTGDSREDVDRLTDHLLRDRPALLSGVLVLTLMFVPFLVCAGSLNQVSGDVATRGLRYLLLRTERTNILLARWLGTAIFVVAALLVINAFVSVYVSFKFSFYGFGPSVAWGARGFLAMALLALPYISLCTLLNTFTDQPIAALVLALLFAAVSGFGPSFVPGAELLPWLPRLTPWGWKFDLLRPDAGRVLLAVAVCFAWTVGLLAVAVRRFARRDL